MKEKYKEQELEKRIELAKALVLDYVSSLIDSYEFDIISKNQLKKQHRPHAKKGLHALLVADDREIHLSSGRKDYQQLKDIIHEMWEIIVCDRDGLDNLIFNGDSVRLFKHERLYEIEREIYRRYKKYSKKAK